MTFDIINDEDLTEWNEAISHVIESLAPTSTLLYPPRRTKCVNCVLDTIGNRSSNIYQSGGPAPFANGTICPLCYGAGYKETQNSRTIKMLCYYTPKDIEKIAGVGVPKGIVMTKGYMSDLPDIMSASEVLINSQLQPYIQERYKIWKEQVPQGFKNNYFVLCFWERIP